MDDLDGGAATTRGTIGTTVGGGICAIAGVRGDVTTVRAVEAVRARGTGVVRPVPSRVLIEERRGFPVRLLDVGPG